LTSPSFFSSLVPPSPIDDVTACFRGLENTLPDDRSAREFIADLLDETRWGWGQALQAACAIQRHVPGVILPDRFPTFRTRSDGWAEVHRQLQELVAHPEDTAAFRHQYERLVRGDVPLDPEHLDQTLRLQYDLQVRLLESLNLLEEEDDDRFLTAIDGKRYPLPAFEDVQARMQTPELQTKLRQGFDTLLLVPFGLPLERFTEALREGLKRNAGTLRGVGAFNQNDPLWMWDQYQREPLAYDPRSFTDDHGGKTKEQLLAEGHRGWDVLLVEGGLQNLPRVSQGQTIGGRPQIECNRTPTQYLTDLRLRGESGLTPEAYVLQFLDTLERRGQVLDIQTFSSLTGSFLPASRDVPGAFWDPQGGQAILDWDDLGDRGPGIGVRAAVRVR
jgi:hypothetical protein